MPFQRRRRPGRWVALVVLAIVVVVLATGSSAGVLAYTNVKDQATALQAELTGRLQAAQAELESAKTSLKQANTKHDPALIAEANVHFTSARVQFMVARQIADNSQLLARLESLPDVGTMARTRHAALDGIVEMGIAVADAGKELADLDGELLKPAKKGQEGRTLLTILEQTRASLVKVREDFKRAEKAATLVDITVLPKAQQAPFLKAKSTITSALATMDEFDHLVPILTEVVGGNGPRTYLVEQVNPGELRGGGGFIGTFSIIQADHGAIKLIRTGRGPDLSYPRALPGQAGYVSPPGPFREWLPNTSWSFQDSNWFPDFPSNAQAAANFVQPRLGVHIDGVISIDFYAVEKMLGLTGSLTVPGYPIVIDGSNFISVLLQHDLAQDGIDKVILSAISGPLMDRIATLPADRWPALIGSLNDLASQRHLQVYFTNAAVQKEMDRVGWSSVVNPTGSKDFMMEVEANLGGNKSNNFVTRNYSIELTRNGPNLHHLVIVHVVNDTPYQYRPNDFYKGYARLYVPASATQPANNLRVPWYSSPAPPPGTRMSEGWITTVRYGNGTEFAFEYDTPWQADSRGQARIYWQKQPGTVVDKAVVKWNDGSGHKYTTTGDLAQDRIITVSTHGVSLTPGQAGLATLPSLSLG